MTLSLGVLGSGSGGNGIVIGNSGFNILIDSGFSGVETEKRLNKLEISPGAIEGIVVSHEHTDHTTGVGVLSRRFDIPVYATRSCAEAADFGNGIHQFNEISPGESFKIGNITVHPFSLPHDAVDPLGFVVLNEKIKAGIATDLGHINTLAEERLSDCHLLVLESNHDVEMLMDCDYPWDVKQRVRSNMGHLSNRAMGKALGGLVGNNTRYVFLAHLSSDNNYPDVALAEAKKSLRGNNRQVDILTTCQDTPTGMFTVESK